MKNFSFITMFDEPLEAFLKSSLMGRAQKNKLININIHSLLKEVDYDHHKLDDSPYGGGPGELLKVDILVGVLEKLSLNKQNKRILLMDPTGKTFNQNTAKRLSSYDELIFISGRYEGIDARIYHFVDEALSLGDFVLSNGDMAALAMADAIARFVPGFVNNHLSILDDSLHNGRLESSIYTRPDNFRGLLVPQVFKTGHHEKILQERRIESIKKTLCIRPDLIEEFPLSKEEEKLLNTLGDENYPWQKLYE